MSDRELLERAAKAAGIAGEWCDCEDCGIGGLMVPNDSGSQWNPLTDDGDALRLAVALEIDPKPRQFGAGADCLAEGISVQELSEDVCAATRRAIVRAAAELGRAHT